jgi:glutamyl-tRNA synthetase
MSTGGRVLATNPSRSNLLWNVISQSAFQSYRGRIAPSPTGYLHLGHARTFWIAQHRATQHSGSLIFRNEDLDYARCKPEFITAALEDLRWFGLHWSEGPDVGGSYAPYNQSERLPHYTAAFERLLDLGLIYPCRCSRQDVLRSLSAPHQNEEAPIYPGTCRPLEPLVSRISRAGVSWRFRVPSKRQIGFIDGNLGPRFSTAEEDFGDFLVWRKDDLPSYQLAVVVDDTAMGITEVVRGADLITSTFRQLLLYEALGHTPPAFHHCSLVTDVNGTRLAKRNNATALRTFRAQGRSPEELRALF